MGKVKVRCKNRQAWGTNVFGPTGTIYRIQPGGELHQLFPSGMVDPEPGVVELDRAEFVGMPNFKVAGAPKAAPAAPKPPLPKKVSDALKAAEGGDDEDPDDATDDEVSTPPEPLGDGKATSLGENDNAESLIDTMPADTAQKKTWLAWAQQHGIALSPAQKDLEPAAIREVIREKVLEIENS